MKFSNYAIGWLFEEVTGDEMNELILKFIEKLSKVSGNPYAKLAGFIKANMVHFAFKPKDISALKLLQYNKHDAKVITGINVSISSISDYIAYSKGGNILLLNAPNANSASSKNVVGILRGTGSQISSYRGEGKNIKSFGADKTNHQEVGVAIWVDILKNNGDTLADYKGKTKIVTGAPDDIKKSLAWMEQQTLTKDRWGEQCKIQAQTILQHFPKIKNGDYAIHQGGPLFDAIRAKGKKLSGVNGTADKWNPSDIYFISKKFTPASLEKCTNILELNSIMGKFDEIIGISLKGARASDGSTSCQNIFKQMKLDFTLPAAYPHTRDGKLTSEMKDEIKTLIKKIIKNSKVWDCGPAGLYLQSGTEYATEAGNDINKLLDYYVIGGKKGSNDWGKSFIPSLHMLARLNTAKLWKDFFEASYALATSQTDVSAPHWKITGKGQCILRGHSELDVSKLKCGRVRIPFSGQTSIVFEATYDGAPQRYEFRSRKSAPLLGLYTRPPDACIFIDFTKLKGLKD